MPITGPLSRLPVLYNDNKTPSWDNSTILLTLNFCYSMYSHVCLRKWALPSALPKKQNITGCVPSTLLWRLHMNNQQTTSRLKGGWHEKFLFYVIGYSWTLGWVLFTYFLGDFLLNKFLQKTRLVFTANCMHCSSIWCKEGVVTTWCQKRNVERMSDSSNDAGDLSLSCWVSSVESEES